MTDLGAQKRLAADVMDVGENRIWLDPEAQGEIAEAITRDEIRELVADGLIQAESASGNSRGRARERNAKRAYGHQKGPGKRKGKKGARQNEKEQWQNQIRAQRRKLRELRDKGEITPTQYRQLYKKAGGGEFRSVRYLLNYIDDNYGEQ
ncbi:50S ribosomal protein L19e [Salinadaptatus halalkaliphilus]|uniref:Large ribosomal subunit protein eL19 n=1 Tax=Salinadaptatus halalkaliphilus TaxID=2419781 RepID=A0A4S3TK53_9EURY|nr:50S ribosomal protein L19e [Salinadaptatus halalkaliphilus]THE64482.1 50S ribosomal protein L19e [Salinadaptatus halalkaliphilus]